MTLPNKRPPRPISVPRPRAIPKLDMIGIGVDEINRREKALTVDKRPFDIINDKLDPSKQAIDAVYEQARQANAPDSPPAVGGFPGIANYPVGIRDVGRDSSGAPVIENRHGTIGRGTLLGGLTDQVGSARAQEIARNMGDRNFGQPDPYDIFPSIHPDGPGAHFNRNFYVIRKNGPAENNGFAYPGWDTISYRKADEGLNGMAPHELNHLLVDYGGKNLDRDGVNSVRVDKPDFWKGALTSNHEKGMTASIHKMLAGAAEDHGLDFDPARGDWGVMRPEDMDHIFRNIDNHFWKNQEQLANGLDWKNLALQRNGYETIADLPKSISERDFFRQALTQDLVPYSPRGATDRFDPDRYNPLQLLYRAARENMMSPGKAMQDKMFYKLGAGAGVAAGLSQEGDQ